MSTANLNSAQYAAITAQLGPVRVLAGAGSGKTRVLVARIAWLLEQEFASPWSILAVTFTNKAAAEMRGRVERQLRWPLRGLWLGTFHGIAHRLLRMHHVEAGLAEGFQILDSDDQQRLVKRVLKALQLDEKKWPPRQAAWQISQWKEAGLRPSHLEQQLHDLAGRQWLAIYRHYEELCQRSNLVDFSELLLRSYELFQQHPELLAHYRQRFNHILVDEFQDTNALQYRWLQQLYTPGGHIFVVGDDDQSIYGWRGAQVANILDFDRDFPNTKTVRLEQNYRSTGNILQAANALIAHNQGRLGKTLWTQGDSGAKLDVYAAFNEYDEARFVVERIRQWVANGGQRQNCAVLYRSNAQSRVLEEALIGAGVPYRVYGGLRFFDRAEIKDALAYLRLMANYHDDPSFERAVNTPPRGIGERTLEQVRAYARDQRVSLWQAADSIVRQQALPARAGLALGNFLNLIEREQRSLAGLPLGEQISRTLEFSGLRGLYAKDSSERGEGKLENLDELVNAASAFAGQGLEEFEGMDPLTAFLVHAALESGEGQGQPQQDCVQLMTMHAAKGLEFPWVALVGWEEGLFPHSMSAHEPGRLEEERRLAYVGITRAQKQLLLSYAESRRWQGKEQRSKASRFVDEIPATLLQDVRVRSSVVRPSALAAQRNRDYSGGGYSAPAARATPARGAPLGPTSLGGFRVGQAVRHPVFGEGVIDSLEGSGAHARAQVRFRKEGLKTLVLAYAKLEGL